MKYKAFTLLEMVVVVMVVSILFLISIPNIARIINSVENVGCNALTKVVDAAIVEFKIDYGQYPSSVSDLINAGYLSPEQANCSDGKSIVIDGGQAYAR